MKKINNILLWVAAITLTACSNNENELNYSNDPDAVVVKANVGAIPTSRTSPLGLTGESTTSFYSGDAIMLSNDGGTSYVKYTLGTDGKTWTPETGKYLKWAKDNLTFQGYYPASASYNSFTVPTDQSEYHTGSAKDIALADYMKVITSEGSYTSTDVSLTFTRQMARVIVVIDGFNNQYPDNSKISDLKIYGAILNGRTGITTSYAVTPYAMNSATGAKGSEYVALLLGSMAPETSLPFLTMNVGTTPHTFTGIPILEAGKSYTFHLTVGKNTVKVSSINVIDWTTGETITDDTDESHKG